MSAAAEAAAEAADAERAVLSFDLDASMEDVSAKSSMRSMSSFNPDAIRAKWAADACAAEAAEAELSADSFCMEACCADIAVDAWAAEAAEAANAADAWI